jgi:surfeit locus 1 family protein
VWTVARRPRWIGALLFALALAGGFAALGQWQLGRAVQTATVVTYPTETVEALSDVAKPQHPVSDRAAGQMVSITGRRIAGDSVVVSDRINYGVTGYWVVGHMVDTGGTSVAVAFGWAKTRAEADSAATTLQSATGDERVVGRYQPPEPPDQQDFEHGVHSAVSIPALINEWKDAPTAVYGGYIVAKQPSAGLAHIYSPKPTNAVTLDWLNVFYAIEWVVFAGFAIYLWYRLVKDAWEKEEFEKLEELANVN